MHEHDQQHEPLLVGVRDAAHLLGLSPTTVRNWCSQGKLPFPSFRVGRRRMFRCADLRAYVDGGCQPLMPRRGRPRAGTRS